MAKCHLSWESYKNNICKGFAGLQQSEEFVDMTLAADGHLVQVHKTLLALASPYIKQMLKMAPSQNPVLFLNGVKHDVLTYLLEYIYTGEVNVPIDKLKDFIQQAKALHIIGIENLIPSIVATQLRYHQNQNSQYDENTETSDLDQRVGSQDRQQHNNLEQQHNNLEQQHNSLEQQPNNFEQPHNNLEQQQFVIEQPFAIYSTPAVESCTELETNITNTNPVDLDNDIVEQNNEATNTNNNEATNTNCESSNETITDLLALACMENVDSTNNNLQNDHNYGKNVIEMEVQANNSDYSAFQNNDSLLIPQQINPTSENNIPIEKPLYDRNFCYNKLESFVTQMSDDNVVVESQPVNYKIEMVLSEDGNITHKITTSENPLIEPVQSSSNEIVPVISEKLANDSTIYYLITVKHRLIAILNRYMYYMHHSSNHGLKRRWRCINYRHQQCKAYIDTFGEEIKKRKFTHIHPFHDYQIMKKAMKGNMYTTIEAALASLSSAERDVKAVSSVDSMELE